MPLTLQIELTDEQLDQIADLVAAKMQRSSPTYYSVAEAAKILRVHPKTVDRRVKANLIPTVPNIRPPRIPAAWLDRQANPFADA